MNPLLQLRDEHQQGICRGIYSVCSAHPLVLRAAMLQCLSDQTPLLIEATCNQVNQFGGYTGMTPADFVKFTHRLALEIGFPLENLILGGDHLGLNPWQDEPAEIALQKASDMVDAYVSAGFQKIHLDTSMRCADDPQTLPDALIAERAAQLCQRAEQAYQRLSIGIAPVYVIGTEVPPPGGSTSHEEDPGLKPTAARDVEQTLAVSEAAFTALGLNAAWQRVIALVIQPGVEFGDASIHDYQSAPAQELVAVIARQAPWMYEAHSTDYQTASALQQLVADRFAILKVGPWLTFALREALYALDDIAREMRLKDPTRPAVRLRQVLDNCMLQAPHNWEKHYSGNVHELAYARSFSFSDRARYYLNDAAVKSEIDRLLSATAEPIPLELLSQYRPQQYQAVRAGQILATGEQVVIHSIREVLGFYAAACR